MSHLRQTLALAANDLRLTARDRASAVWMLLLPLAFMWMFSTISGGGAPPKASLAVEDRDGGWLAKALVREIPGDGLEVSVISPAAPAGPAAQSRARQDGAVASGRGPAPAGPAAQSSQAARRLVIPEGFTANVLAGRQQKLVLENAEGTRGEYNLAAEAHILRAIVRIVGRLAEVGPPIGGVGGLDGVGGDPGGSSTEREMGALASRKPLVSVSVSRAGGGHPVPHGFAQSVPGTLTMTVLMMTVIYGAVFLTLEKRQGVIRRQVSLPLPRSSIFLGKLAGRFLIAAVQAVVLLAAGRFIFGVSWGSSPGGLALLLVSFLVCVAAISTFLGAALATPEQASAVGWIASMLLAALGGCWWPSEVMPRWLWRAAHALPTPWAMDGFHALISFGRGVEAVLLPSAALLGFALVFGVLGSRFLRTG